MRFQYDDQIRYFDNYEGKWYYGTFVEYMDSDGDVGLCEVFDSSDKVIMVVSISDVDFDRRAINLGLI